MTYPPQQPPQGPYDPNQNPYGQQPPQQPGWQQQPPPQGYDAYGPQQPPPGYDPYAQPTQQYNPYGQPTQQYGYPGGYPQPPKKKTGLLVGLAVAGVIVVGGGVTAIALLSGNDSDNNPGTTNVADSSPAGTAEELVDRVITAIGNRDAKGAAALMCDPSRPGPATELDQMPPGAAVKARRDTDIRHSGSSATAKLDLFITQNGRNVGLSTLTLKMTEKQPGKWCVDRASMDAGASTARRPPSTRPTS
ncbi:hypothetical protein GCM10029964_045370 [Kibdelosporangium lantanae]